MTVETRRTSLNHDRKLGFVLNQSYLLVEVVRLGIQDDLTKRTNR